MKRVKSNISNFARPKEKKKKRKEGDAWYEMRGKEKRLSRLCLQRRNRRENFPFSTCPRRTTLSCEKEVVDQLNFCSLVSRNFFPPQRLPKKKTSLPLLGPRSNVVQFFPPRVVASSTDFVNLLQGKIFSFFSRRSSRLRFLRIRV